MKSYRLRRREDMKVAYLTIELHCHSSIHTILKEVKALPSDFSDIPRTGGTGKIYPTTPSMQWEP